MSESDYTGRKLSRLQKIEALRDGGICETYMDAYWMLVDMGEITENDSVYRSCLLRDNVPPSSTDSLK